MFKWREDQQNVIHNTNIKRGITNSFARTLKVLQQKHLQFSNEEFIYSNDASNNLCNSLEAAFLHGLKDSVAHKLTMYVGLAASSEWSPDMNFWGVVVKFTHSDVVTQLQNLTQISTEIGLCRAWVRLALNDGLMESYLHSMIVDTKTLKYFYHSYSFLRDHEQPGILKNLLTGLMSLDFKLSCNSSVLNSWSNNTLQLIGVVDTHFAPSPAISQTERGQSGLLPPKELREKDQKISKVEEPMAVSRDAPAASQGVDSSMFRSIPDVEELQHAGDLRKSLVADVALSVSEGSSSSHLSCPDPDVGAASLAEVGAPETVTREISAELPSVHSRDESDNLSEKSSSLAFPDYHCQEKEQGESTEHMLGLPERVDHLFDDETEERLKSLVVLDEAGNFDYQASPTRPRSRRVDEEDLRHLCSSSYSPPTTLERSNAQQFFNQHEKIQDIVYTTFRSHHKKSHLHSDVAQEHNLPPDRVDGTNDAVTPAVDESGVQIMNETTEKGLGALQIYSSVPSEPEEVVRSSMSLSDEQRNSVQSREGHEDYENDGNILVIDSNNTRLDGCSNFHHSARKEHDTGVSAEEVTNSRTQENSSEPRQIRNTEEAEVESEMSMSPSRFGNSLSSLSGWSSEIESKRERKRQKADRKRAESFASMLRTYSPVLAQASQAVTLNQVIETLPCDHDDEEEEEDHKSRSDSPAQNAETVQWNDSGLEDFEVLKSPTELFCGQVEANSSRMFFLFHVPREHGLSHQNFACKGCSGQIGLIYGKPRLCEFDGGLYCHTCHENSETYIPSSILYDWDFRKKKVCQENYKFLVELEEQALFDVEELNPKLYNHVPELQDLKLLRQQLCYLKSYLFTCSQKVAESLRQKVWPREHLYNRRDLYSVMDFVQVQSGSLQKLVKDLVKFASQHVYDCVLCSLKGFVCEICRNPQVIYPFELDTTMRCKKCKAVYHKTCMTESLPCPKCERWGHHVSSSNLSEDNPEDYGISPRAY